MSLMHNPVWNSLIDVKLYFETIFNNTGEELYEPAMKQFNQSGWENKVWSSVLYRRAHINVVDARETKGLWMMHCCIFPHIHNPAPIFGFDVIAGKNKITGCFIDYSPAGDVDHPMIANFRDIVLKYTWNKPRVLPAWAERIFSPYIVAAGNISSEIELSQITELAAGCIDNYLERVADSNYNAIDTTLEQNIYAQNQKLNPHTPKVMTSLGLLESDVQLFIKECLFPEIT